MAMKKRYHTVNGMLIGETTNGVRRGYLPDALGSVVATVDNTGSVENRYWYKPFGVLLAKEGTGPDPHFRWRGSLAYRSSVTSVSAVYGSIRHLDVFAGQWTSVDSFWPTVAPYSLSWLTGSGKAYKFCDGCKSTDLPCPEYPWRTATCTELVRRALLLLESYTSCFCGAELVGTVHIHFDRFCVESKDKAFVGKVPCWIRNDDADCGNISVGLTSGSCMKEGCDKDCKKVAVIPGVKTALPAGPFTFGDFKIGQIKGTIEIKGKFIVYGCKRKPEVC